MRMHSGVVKVLAVLALCLGPHMLFLSGQHRMNVLFVVADDLGASALGSFGNSRVSTPNIDRLASQGTRFTRAYAQYPVCGPSRASFMSGLYPDRTGIMRNSSDQTLLRSRIGDAVTFSQFFKNRGYYAARVGKIYHMRVPNDILDGTDGPDDPASWTEAFNSPGPEWMAPGEAKQLDPKMHYDKARRRGFGTGFYRVKADGDDLVHADGKAALKAIELIQAHKEIPFFLAVGFVRPHVPLVAPRSYFHFYPPDAMRLPAKLPGDWDDIPEMGINYKTSQNMGMTVPLQKEGLAAYYASVSYMDAQLGKVLDALERSGLRDKTIVVFTSDHGYHLGEHDFWEKVSLHEESARVPLIVSVPGQKPAVCRSLTELIDLYPSIVELAGYQPPTTVQGTSFAGAIHDPTLEFRADVLSVNARAKLLRTRRYAYIEYQGGEAGVELYDMREDPQQFTNLANRPDKASTVQALRSRLHQRVREARGESLNGIRGSE